MLSRRTFLSLAAGSIAVPRLAAAQPTAQKAALYANVGADLTHYDVDVPGAELIKRETVTLPAAVQYAWPHASRRYLYVATSSSAPGYGTAGTEHHVTAFAIDPVSGALTAHGTPIRLPTRPIHVSTDIPSENILVAFNNPSAVHVYRVNKDFTPGEEVTQPGPIDAGIFAHQVRVTPDNRLAILVTRGNEGTSAKAEDPGALKVFAYKNGVLTNEVSIAPNGGKEFGPRHLDFHPTKPWMYVSIETQNKMYMFRMADGRINPDVAYSADTLAEPNNIRARQAAGTVHVHPNGRFVYGANRAEATTEFQGKPVFKGGENSIVVYSINQSTGEPTPIQHIETQKIHPRTFHIDPSGRLLVAQHNRPVNVRDGDAVKTVPAGLSVFRMGDDGKLTFARKYDVDVGDKTMFWMGMVPLPEAVTAMPVEMIGWIAPRVASELIPPSGPPFDAKVIAETARIHERAGFDRVLIGYFSDAPDGFLVGAHAASVTERLAFLLAHRPGFVAPPVAARKLATLDQLSDGRLAVHMIAGGSDADQAKDGDWTDHEVRYRRSAEYMSLLRRTWTEASPFDHEGEFYRTRGTYAEIRCRQQPHIPIYGGGGSDAAIRALAPHVDVFMLWGEPLKGTALFMDRVRREAARSGRQPTFSLSTRPILAATDGEAWDRARAILDRVLANRGGAPAPQRQNIGSQRLLQAAAEAEVHDTCLWTPLAAATGASGNSTALVGTPETVARALLEYYKLGATSLLIRGYDPRPDAVRYGEELIPRIRELVTEHDARLGAGSAVLP